MKIDILLAAFFIRVKPGREKELINSFTRFRGYKKNSFFTVLGYFDIAYIAEFSESLYMKEKLLASQLANSIADFEFLPFYIYGKNGHSFFNNDASFILFSYLHIDEREKITLGLKAEHQTTERIVEIINQQKPKQKPETNFIIGGNFEVDCVTLQKNNNLKKLITNLLRIRNNCKTINHSLSSILISQSAMSGEIEDQDPEGWDRHVEIHISLPTEIHDAVLSECRVLLEKFENLYKENYKKSNKAKLEKRKNTPLSINETSKPSFSLLYEIGERDFIMMLHGDILRISRAVYNLRKKYPRIQTVTSIYERQIGQIGNGHKEQRNEKQPADDSHQDLSKIYERITKKISLYERLGRAGKIFYPNFIESEDFELLRQSRDILESALKLTPFNLPSNLAGRLVNKKVIAICNQVLEFIDINSRKNVDEEYHRRTRILLLNVLWALNFAIKQRQAWYKTIGVNTISGISEESLGGVQKVNLAVDGLIYSLLQKVCNYKDKYISQYLSIIGYRHIIEYLTEGIINLPRSLLLLPEEWAPIFHECGHIFVKGSYNSPNDNLLIKRTLKSFINKLTENDIKMFSDDIEQSLADIFAYMVGFRQDYVSYSIDFWRHIIKNINLDEPSVLITYFLRSFIVWLFKKEEENIDFYGAEKINQFFTYFDKEIIIKFKPKMQKLLSKALTNIKKETNFSKLIESFNYMSPFIALHAPEIRKQLNKSTGSYPANVLKVDKEIDLGSTIEDIENGTIMPQDLIIYLSKKTINLDSDIDLSWQQMKPRIIVILALYHYSLTNYSDVINCGN